MYKFFIHIAIIICCFFSAQNLDAQVYKSAVGARLGWGIRASYKTFLNEKHALELYAGFGGFIGTHLSAGALYLIHQPIGSVENLNWYYGGGVVANYWSFSEYGGLSEGYFQVGVRAGAGLDYKFKNAPINLSVDLLPTFYLIKNGLNGFFGIGGGGLSVRYVLKDS